MGADVTCGRCVPWSAYDGNGYDVSGCLRGYLTDEGKTWNAHDPVRCTRNVGEISHNQTERIEYMVSCGVAISVDLRRYQHLWAPPRILQKMQFLQWASRGVDCVAHLQLRPQIILPVTVRKVNPGLAPDVLVIDGRLSGGVVSREMKQNGWLGVNHSAETKRRGEFKTGGC